MPAPTTAVRPLQSEAARFLLVGGAATVVDVGLFNVLHLLAGLDPVLSKVLSTAVAAVVAFLGNRSWSFVHGDAQEVGTQVLPYLAVTVVGLGIAVVPIEVARAAGLEGALAMNVAANLVGLGLATAFRFYGYRRWVFRPASPEPQARPLGLRQGERQEAPLRHAA